MTLSFSQLAEADLKEIGNYTLEQWGTQQAIRYLDQLETGCERLAENPLLGRSCADIRPGLRRIQEGQHVVFYRVTENGIVVSRVLHQRMLPEQHSMSDV